MYLLYRCEASQNAACTYDIINTISETKHGSFVADVFIVSV